MAVVYSAPRKFARRRILVFSVIRDGLLHGLTFARPSSSCSSKECFYTRLLLAAYTFRAGLFLEIVLLSDSIISERWWISLTSSTLFSPRPAVLSTTVVRPWMYIISAFHPPHQAAPLVLGRLARVVFLDAGSAVGGSSRSSSSFFWISLFHDICLSRRLANLLERKAG